MHRALTAIRFTTHLHCQAWTLTFPLCLVRWYFAPPLRCTDHYRCKWQLGVKPQTVQQLNRRDLAGDKANSVMEGGMVVQDMLHAKTKMHLVLPSRELDLKHYMALQKVKTWVILTLNQKKQQLLHLVKGKHKQTVGEIKSLAHICFAGVVCQSINSFSQKRRKKVKFNVPTAPTVHSYFHILQVNINSYLYTS